MRRPLATLLPVFMALALAGCQAPRGGESRSAPTPQICRGVSDCPFAETCNDGACAPAECTPGDTARGVAQRECRTGRACWFEDGAAMNNGVGMCAEPVASEEPALPLDTTPVF